MKVCVLGLWHLGTVTAACAAAGGHTVVGLDFDAGVIAGLEAGRPPVFEPGLADSVSAQLAAGRLRFTTDVQCAADADVLWVTYDTPVDEEDRADVEQVIECTARVLPLIRDEGLVLVSSQLPVGSTARLELRLAARGSGHAVMCACSPENLRLGQAIDAFTRPGRVIAGTRSALARDRVAELFAPFCDRIEWMSVESAEMSKHAINAFLATSVTFINEIADLCERVGADAGAVERALKSEARIGPKVYLAPGAAFSGGTLARDIVALTELGSVHGAATHLLSSIRASNDLHRDWAQRRLAERLDGVAGKTVGIWGLAYKPGTDTLRRSSAIELCRWLKAQGAAVRAHDPAVTALPDDLAPVMTLAATPLAVLTGASALVVATSWPIYRQVAADDVVARMARALVLDADRFTTGTLGSTPWIEYISVGAGAA